MWGVVAATFAQCAVGALVYSGHTPTGRLWMGRTFPGKTEKEIGQETGPAMGFALVSAITVSLLLKFILVDFFKMKVLMDGIKFAIGLFSLMAVFEIPHVLFSKRSVDLFIVDQIYNFFALLITAACLFYLG